MSAKHVMQLLGLILCRFVGPTTMLVSVALKAAYACNPLSYTFEFTPFRNSPHPDIHVSLTVSTYLHAGHPTGEAASLPAEMSHQEGPSEGGLQPFPMLTKTSVEALRYRAEDIARSLTKTVIKEVSHESTHEDGCNLH